MEPTASLSFVRDILLGGGGVFLLICDFLVLGLETISFECESRARDFLQERWRWRERERERGREREREILHTLFVPDQLKYTRTLLNI